MNEQPLTLAERREVLRPLPVLADLCKRDFEDAAKAAEHAVKNAKQPFFEAIGVKFIEARAQTTYSEFLAWTKKSFNIGETQSRWYCKLGKETIRTGGAVRHASITQFKKAHGHKPSRRMPNPVSEELKQIDFKALRQAELKRAEENKLRAELANRMIDVGYRLLANRMHPDHGGTTDGMRRLTEVREKLKRGV